MEARDAGSGSSIESRTQDRFLDASDVSVGATTHSRPSLIRRRLCPPRAGPDGDKPGFEAQESGGPGNRQVGCENCAGRQWHRCVSSTSTTCPVVCSLGHGRRRSSRATLGSFSTASGAISQGGRRAGWRSGAVGALNSLGYASVTSSVEPYVSSTKCSLEGRTGPAQLSDPQPGRTAQGVGGRVLRLCRDEARAVGLEPERRVVQPAKDDPPPRAAATQHHPRRWRGNRAALVVDRAVGDAIAVEVAAEGCRRPTVGVAWPRADEDALQDPIGIERSHQSCLARRDVAQWSASTSSTARLPLRCRRERRRRPCRAQRRPRRTGEELPREAMMRESWPWTTRSTRTHATRLLTRRRRVCRACRGVHRNLNKGCHPSSRSGRGSAMTRAVEQRATRARKSNASRRTSKDHAFVEQGHFA